jgi:uncharacterized protein YcbK (DUF882 family)
MDGIYDHFSLAPWQEARWPNFRPAEMSCPHCGEYYHFERLFDAIQWVRSHLNRPIHINSSHRCPFYNASRRIGGAALSEHKMRVALDIGLRGHDPAKLYGALQEAGFSTFGFYGNFIHVDAREGRRWFSKTGRETWNGLVT